MNNKRDKKSIIVAYIPVLHEGYLRFFNKHHNAKELWLLGPEVTKEYKQLVKDLRAISPAMMKTAIEALGLFDIVKVVQPKDLMKVDASQTDLIMPEEDVMRDIREKYFPNTKVSFDSIFLRWDKHKSFESRPVEANQRISRSAFDRKMMKLLKLEAEKSADFWRHIGAAIVKDGKMILKVHNRAVPAEQIHYVEGDPRSDFSKGVNVDLSLFMHCEAQIVAEAAHKGISLAGSSLYVTTFPCPACAKLVAYSGIKELYYRDGYGVLDGERVLKSRGVKIVFVKTGK